ncbi:MAG: hypothetical protein AAFX50_20210, partial [Acidobacteriota bacterium]
MPHAVSERVVAAKSAHALIADPYLHVGDDRIYNPLTDELLESGQPGYADLRRVLDGLPTAELEPAALDALVRGAWVVVDGAELDARFRLKFVSLEAHTICNQACYFCPVSINPRESYFMPTEQYHSILEQLAAYKDTIEGVFMINYNEPTVDKRFLDQGVDTVRGQAGAVGEHGGGQAGVFDRPNLVEEALVDRRLVVIDHED